MANRTLTLFPSAAFFTLFFLASCANSHTHHNVSEPVGIHKLFILTQVGAEDNTVFANSLGSAMVGDIQSCHIESRIENVPVKDRSLSLDTDPFVAVNADIKQFAPDYILRIAQNNSTELSRTVHGIDFNVTLIRTSGPITPGTPLIWSGLFKSGSQLDANSGTLLAKSIMDKVKQENVIQGCDSPMGDMK